MGFDFSKLPANWQAQAGEFRLKAAVAGGTASEVRFVVE